MKNELTDANATVKRKPLYVGKFGGCYMFSCSPDKEFTKAENKYYRDDFYFYFRQKK